MENKAISGRLRVGMAGAGRITAYHLKAWQKVGDTEVVAIADPAKTKALDRAGEFQIRHVYDDVADMLAGEKLDVLDIVSPNEFHAAHVRLAARHGLAALCQKPLTERFVESEHLVDEVEGGIRHFTECIRTAKPFESSPRDNLETLRLVEAAYLAAGLGAS